MAQAEGWGRPELLFLTGLPGEKSSAGKRGPSPRRPKKTPPPHPTTLKYPRFVPKHKQPWPQERTHLFSRTCPLVLANAPAVPKNAPTCSQEHPHLFSRTSPLVLKNMPTCSQEHPHLFSRTSPPVPKNIPTCSQEHPRMFPRTSPLVLKNIPTCSQEHPHLFSRTSPLVLANAPTVPKNAPTCSHTEPQGLGATRAAFFLGPPRKKVAPGSGAPAREVLIRKCLAGPMAALLLRSGAHVQ